MTVTLGNHQVIDVDRWGDFSAETRLEVMECPVCGVKYALPKMLLDRARKDPGRWWCCPNGHDLHFPGKTEAEKLKEQLEVERLRSGRLAHQRDQAQASLRATRGVATRRKKQLARVAAGVCPCCNRTFPDLARHMATKHPGVSP